MSERKLRHVPTPWQLGFREGKYEVVADDGSLIAVIGPYSMERETARRIIACVNACDAIGISNSSLESGGLDALSDLANEAMKGAEHD